MLYIITKLVTEGQQKAFSIIGASEDKKRAAAIAAEVYKDYNKNASFQNIEMITEWLATRQNYSFRKDKDHRLQLAITRSKAKCSRRKSSSSSAPLPRKKSSCAV
mgnify:CR=1 FL=1